jgi:hypothetical protein
VNVSRCPEIEGKKQADGKVYSCRPNLNRTHNGSLLCACVPGRHGLNCALGKGVDLVAAVVSAGIIAAIIAAALLGVLLAGGGAIAGAQAMAATNVTGVSNNPLYEAATETGQNPLYGTKV